jgi:hypothetical protein
MRTAVPLVVNLVANGSLRKIPSASIPSLRPKAYANRVNTRQCWRTKRWDSLTALPREIPGRRGRIDRDRRSLRRAHHDAVYLRDEGLIRLPDPKVAAKAAQGGQNRVYIRSGFREIFRRGQRYMNFRFQKSNGRSRVRDELLHQSDTSNDYSERPLFGVTTGERQASAISAISLQID